jgi:hypothetical protein
MIADAAPRLLHRTATVRLRLTRRQARRCYGLLRSAGDVWAWLLDSNRQRQQQGERPVTGYQAWCRQLTGEGPFGELSVVGARSVLRRYSDAWFQAAKRRQAGQRDTGFPRRKRALVPVRFYHGTFLLDGSRVRLPVAKGQPELWVRLARPLPYPPEQVRAVTLLAEGGRLWLAVTAAVPVQQHDLDPRRVAGVDLGIIHPYAVVAEDGGCWCRGGRCVPRATSTSRISRHARPGQPAGRPGRGSVVHGGGVAIGPACASWRRVTGVVSTTPSMRPPSRSSPSPSSSGSAHWWSGIPKGLPPRTRAGCRTGGCGSGVAPTLCRRCGTRPSWRGWWCGWWTSVAPPPPAPPATNASPSPRAAGSVVRTAGSRGIGIWSVPPTSPPRPAADPRA